MCKNLEDRLYILIMVYCYKQKALDLSLAQYKLVLYISRKPYHVTFIQTQLKPRMLHGLCIFFIGQCQHLLIIYTLLHIFSNFTIFNPPTFFDSGGMSTTCIPLCTNCINNSKLKYGQLLMFFGLFFLWLYSIMSLAFFLSQENSCVFLLYFSWYHQVLYPLCQPVPNRQHCWKLQLSFFCYIKSCMILFIAQKSENQYHSVHSNIFENYFLAQLWQLFSVLWHNRVFLKVSLQYDS